MYLARSISWQGRTARMVGAIPGDAVMHERPVGRGYVHLEPTAAMPWAHDAEEALRGHEFHHSSLENLDPGVGFAYRVARGHGVDGRSDGILVHRLLASYAHLRSAGTQWVPRFADYLRSQRAAAGAAAAPAA
jgi:cobyrinic acid a,c-diamide synthase